MNRAVKRAKIHQRGSEPSQLITVLIAITVIAVIMAAGLFATQHFEMAQSSARQAKLPSDDEIYTGSILFVPNDGIICRQLFFDNRTGLVTDNGLVDCLHAYYQDATGVPIQWSAARAQVISESFRGR
jgi:hypothetical protein